MAENPLKKSVEREERKEKVKMVGGKQGLVKREKKEEKDSQGRRHGEKEKE